MCPSGVSTLAPGGSEGILCRLNGGIRAAPAWVSQNRGVSRRETPFVPELHQFLHSVPGNEDRTGPRVTPASLAQACALGDERATLRHDPG